LTALLRGRRLGEPEPAATAADAPDGVAAAATVTPTPQVAATTSRLSSEFKWPSPTPPSAQADQVEDDNVECDEQDDEVVATEWTLDAGAASDVNEDEEDELPHLDDVDVVDVMAAAAIASLAGANSDERKETERRGDDEEQVAIPFRTPPLPPDRIA
jgi:hypothetical protein